MCFRLAVSSQLTGAQASSREKLHSLQEQMASIRQQLLAEQKVSAVLREETEQLKAAHEEAQRVALSSAAGRSQSDWEERLRTVTDHLMQKVTTHSSSLLQWPQTGARPSSHILLHLCPLRVRCLAVFPPGSSER